MESRVRRRVARTVRAGGLRKRTDGNINTAPQADPTAPLTRRTAAPRGRSATCRFGSAYAAGRPRRPHRNQPRQPGRHNNTPAAGVTEDQGVSVDRWSNSSSERNLRCGNTLPAAIFSCVMAQLVKVVRPVGRSTLTSWTITRTWHR
jgi:hypothetical protein